MGEVGVTGKGKAKNEKRKANIDAGDGAVGALLDAGIQTAPGPPHAASIRAFRFSLFALPYRLTIHRAYSSTRRKLATARASMPRTIWAVMTSTARQ